MDAVEQYGIETASDVIDKGMETIAPPPVPIQSLPKMIVSAEICRGECVRKDGPKVLRITAEKSTSCKGRPVDQS